ncbi:MAG: hypothetical protein HFI34_06765 [Lachnospiraceae bacterium]|nr:hypothetical protein [Lachnospiraceae bacterium]
MLTSDELYTVADGMIEIFDKLNEWAIIDMSERIVAMMDLGVESLPGTVIYLQWVAEQSGLHYSYMIDRIAKLSDISSEELHELFKAAGMTSLEHDNLIYSEHKLNVPKQISYERMSEANKQIIEEMYDRTKGEMENFTRTTADATRNTFIKACDMAASKVAFGYMSLEQAIAEAVKQIAKEGATVTYPSGHKDSIETAVRRAVSTGVNQMSNQLSVKNALDMGCEYVIISSHLGARINDKNKIANHYGWQGKIYKLEGKTKEYGNLREETGFDYTGRNSDPLGFSGYNCRHSLFPYFLGDPNPYKQYDYEENKKKYNENVKKRELERKRRKSKNTVNGYSAAIEAAKQGSRENTELCKELETEQKKEQEQIKKANAELQELEQPATEKTNSDEIPEHEAPVLVKTIDKSNQEEIRKELQIYEENAINEDIETAYIITTDGEVYNCFGTDSRVFPDYDLGDKLHGAIISHNHLPDLTEYSFSDNDLMLFMEYHLETLRGFDNKYIYEFTRNPKNLDAQPSDWMNFENYQHAAMIDKARKLGIGYRRRKNDQGTGK